MQLRLWVTFALLTCMTCQQHGHVISIVAYQRPIYFERLLKSLSECVGIEKYTVLFFLEPSGSGVTKLAQNFDAAAETIVHINPQRLGFYRNIR
jgi:hypothetical protein